METSYNERNRVQTRRLQDLLSPSIDSGQGLSKGVLSFGRGVTWCQPPLRL